MKKSGKIIALLLACAVIVAGCKNNDSSTSADASAGSGKSVGNSVFRIAKAWDKTGIRNHYHGGSNIGALEWFAVEPLVQYVRSTDELYYLLAESIEHKDDHTSVIHLRKDAKWQNGDDFVAEDVMAYYHINFVELTNYLAKPIEKIDDKTVKMTWKTWMEPNDKVKTLLIAANKVGSVQYKEFKTYVDDAQTILSQQPDVEEGYTGWAPFGKRNSKEAEALYLANYNAFKGYNPDWFVATGPYKLEKVTQNQMILAKNEKYYFADNVKYGRILASNVVDINSIYNMLSNGEIDYQDGLAPEATLNSILDKNKDLAHLKMFDPGAIGVVFNLEKPIWTADVRRAFQSIFNREEMRNAGNKYGVVSDFPMIGMAPSEAKIWMDEKSYNAIPRYKQDQDEAAKLLEKAGWTKANGKWQANGQNVKLSLGYDGSHPGMSGVAEAVESALSNFGIEVVMKRASDFSSWFDTAKAQDSAYDFVVNWTDLNMNFSYPSGSFSYMYNDIDGPVMKLPRFTQEDYDNGLIEQSDIGALAVKYRQRDGSGDILVKDVISGFYSYSDDELKQVLGDMVLGAAEKDYGIQFYQNVTGSFVNTGTVNGLPLQSEIDKGRNVTKVPEAGTDDFFAVARTNFYFSQGINFSLGLYGPK